MDTESAFLLRRSDPTAIGLRSENVKLQPSCSTLCMEQASGSGAFPRGKICPISPKQWYFVWAYSRQKLGIGLAVFDTNEKSSSRTNPRLSNSRVYRSSAAVSRAGNCAGVAGGNE